MTVGSKAMVNAKSTDLVRIECVGETRAVTCPGSVWVAFHDARLDLLEACQAVEAYFATTYPGVSFVDALKKLRSQVRAAIAKATGE